MGGLPCAIRDELKHLTIFGRNHQNRDQSRRTDLRIFNFSQYKIRSRPDQLGHIRCLRVTPAISPGFAGKNNLFVDGQLE